MEKFNAISEPKSHFSRINRVSKKAVNKQHIVLLFQLILVRQDYDVLLIMKISTQSFVRSTRLVDGKVMHIDDTKNNISSV